jgi:replicative DNA helicase
MIESVTDLKRTRRQRPAREDSRPTLDRLPPHDAACEIGVLGCCLLLPNQCIAECIEALKDDGKAAFYDLRHQTIYEHLVAMFDARTPVDLISVQARLKDAQLLEQVGGIAYLSQLQDAVPSAANLSWYLGIVKEKFLLRRMIATCTGVVGQIYDWTGEADELLDEIEKEILRVNESRAQTGTRKMPDLVQSSIAMVENYFARQGEITGIATGFDDFDKMTDGLHSGEMIVIAARPSCGKTSLAMNIAEHVAVNLKLPVGVFSLEMSAESLVLRMMCSLGRVNLRNIRDGFMTQADFPKLTNAAGKLNASPLHIDDTAALSILQLRARARRMHQQHGIKLFVIDYLQLMHSTSRKASDNRQVEIADISGGIKALAKELKVPVIVLAQLNREIEKDKSRKPRLSDLRESGSIEQDADLVGMLYKPEADDDVNENTDGQPVNLLIAKQRNGPTGDVHLTFLKPYTRFESASKISGEDAP